MKTVDYILTGIIIACVALVILRMVRGRRKGGCSCGMCNSCAAKNNCDNKKEQR